VEELPVIDSEDDQPASEEPEEITLGGDDAEDDYVEDDDFDEDDDDFDEDDDDSDEDDDDFYEDDDDSDEDDDDFDEDDDDSDEYDDDSDEYDDDFDEEDDDSDEDDDESDEITLGGDDEDDYPEDDYFGDEDSDENDADSDEEEIVIGGTEGEPEEIVIGGDAEEEPEETPAEEEKKPESKSKKAEKSSGKNKAPALPAPVIGPRDLDKVRALRAETKKKLEDASLNSDDQDFQKHFLVSSSPHLHCGETTKIVMQDVIIALLPALAISIVYYGWRALMLTAVCVLSCVLSEYVCRRVMNRRQTISDFSAVVTGILLAFCLPPELNPLFAVVGSIVAIVVVKQLFGGIGSNFANPAATARIVLMLSFPAAMTTFCQPFSWMGSSLDTVSSATPLVDPANYNFIDLLLGVHGGCLGETCAIALLLGGGYLLLRGIISWHIPVAFIGSSALFALIFGMNPIAQICSGGLLLGAFFMATDYVTSPVNKRGQIVFGIGCGLLTMVIRRFGAMAEGVSFAILLMNILSPHIERLTTPKPFGEEGKQA